MDDTTECVEGTDRQKQKATLFIAIASLNISCYLISLLMADCVETHKFAIRMLAV